MKPEKIDVPNGAERWLMDAPENPEGDRMALAEQIMNFMEQGILVWNGEGVCELHNTRIFEVLEISGEDLSIGTTREEFRERAVQRGEMSASDRETSRKRIETHQPYAFDRILPSGRVVLTNARPSRERGYVVTFTDVTAARQAAVELDNAKKQAEDASAKAKAVLADERSRQNEAKMLAELDEWLQSCKSLEELYMVVNRFMIKLLPGSEGELYIYSNSRDVLDGVCQWGDGPELHKHIAPDSCWSLRRGRHYTFEADGMCFPCEHVHEDVPTPDEYICVPIVAHGDTVGLLHIRFDMHDVSAAHVTDSTKFAVRCAEHISMAIANVKLRDELHDQSIRDPLTGLYNRRYFMDAIRREIAVADRGGDGFGLFSFDADKFKTFNDNHGHEAGDMVLRVVSERARTVMPPGAVCCRMGGEEFAVLLPGATVKDTNEAAEKLRCEIAETQVRTAYGVLPTVTISAGVAGYVGEGGSPNSLLKLADEAMYEAKESGRNCVVVAKSN